MAYSWELGLHVFLARYTFPKAPRLMGFKMVKSSMDAGFRGSHAFEEPGPDSSIGCFSSASMLLCVCVCTAVENDAGLFWTFEIRTYVAGSYDAQFSVG